MMLQFLTHTNLTPEFWSGQIDKAAASGCALAVLPVKMSEFDEEPFTPGESIFSDPGFIEAIKKK